MLIWISFFKNINIYWAPGWLSRYTSHFGSGRDLAVCELEPGVGLCADGSVLTAPSLEPVLESVSPSLSDPPLFMLCLSLKNKR